MDIKVTTSLCTAVPSQVAIAEFLRTGKYDRHVKRLRTAIQKQMEMMQRCIGCHFPAGTKVTRPTGGSVLWIELPPRIDSREYFFHARAMGIGVVPGLIFSTLDKYNNFVRLTCSGVWTKEIQQGIEKLGELAEQMKK
jgi:DNA-binding transcriptional MocR family regulator